MFFATVLAAIEGCDQEHSLLKSVGVLSLEENTLNLFHILTLLIFFLAIVHTLLTHKIRQYADKVESKHRKRLKKKNLPNEERGRERVSFFAECLFFLGEVEVVFAVWAIPLFALIAFFYNWTVALDYINTRDYSEALYVVVIMIIASTRPIVLFTEMILRVIANLFGSSVTAWWFVVMTIGPITGSVLTEPAAMVLCCMLLSRKFYSYHPSVPLAYATLGLLFVNVSVGGVLTNFAAPPVVVVASCWELSSWYMFKTFGIIAIIGVLLCNFIYWHFFRSEFRKLNKIKEKNPIPKIEKKKVPLWITAIHCGILAWMIFHVHYPAVVIASLLLFLGFHRATHHHQDEMYLKRPFLVGAFLAGLVIHGGVQGWWVTAILDRLHALSLMIVGVILSAFIENAAVTYLTSLTPDLTSSFKYAIIAAAVTGGGLTVIAHAANPVGQALLEKHFKQGVAPLYLFLSALLPTIIFFILYYIPFLLNGF
jgi:hypothetical protein